MHSEILNRQQAELLPLMKKFKREFYLVGGTAIALYLGHRRSIDFDLFKEAAINHKKIIEKIQHEGFSCAITRRVDEQMNLIVNDVKITFFRYPFTIKANTPFQDTFRLPSLLDLAAMKAYALGRRSKWKDYVDLYFLLNGTFSLQQIVNRATEIFGDLFSEKLFRSQLSYFEDIDYSEAVDYLIPDPPTETEIKQELTKISLQEI